MSSLGLKRAAGVLYVTIGWTLRDMKEFARDLVINLLRFLLAVIMVLTPIGWLLSLFVNFQEGMELRRHITENTRWIRPRKRGRVQE